MIHKTKLNLITAVGLLFFFIVTIAAVNMNNV